MPLAFVYFIPFRTQYDFISVDSERRAHSITSEFEMDFMPTSIAVWVVRPFLETFEEGSRTCFHVGRTDCHFSFLISFSKTVIFCYPLMVTDRHSLKSAVEFAGDDLL